MNTALAELERIAGARDDPAARTGTAEHGRPVIAHLGADVPRAAIEATGATPVRLFPRPSAAGAGAGEALAALGPGVDPALVPLVDDIAARRLAVPVVVDHSADDHLRAWQTIGWLRGEAVTDVHLVDLLHLDRPPTHTYNRRQIEALVARLGAWTGTPVTDERLHAAIAVEIGRRRALGSVLALRHGDRPRLTGTQALAVTRAGWMIGAAEHARLLDELHVTADRLALVEQTRRALVVGGPPASGYEALEARGLHVVGEDHDEGGRAASSVARLRAADPFGALVDLHHHAPQSATRLAPERRCREIELALTNLGVDVLVVDAGDSPTRWLLPQLRQIAETRGCSVESWDPRAAA